MLFKNIAILDENYEIKETDTSVRKKIRSRISELRRRKRISEKCMMERINF